MNTNNKRGLSRLLILACLLSLWSCFATRSGDKIRGFNLESPPMEIGEDEMNEIKISKANWVAIVPYGYTPRGESKVYYDSPFQWWGERKEGVVEMIKSAKSSGFKVMLKPQVWIPGSWVGDYLPESMDVWEKSVTEFTLVQASLAQEQRVDIFCFATEYKIIATEYPEVFRRLIKSIRQVYDGKLTYAANWDEYEQVPFWSDWDFIGVNAYFPLVQNKVPTATQLEKAWEPKIQKLNELHQRYQKPILYTEFGYRSVEGAAGNQWEVESNPFNQDAQSVAFQSFFANAWDQPWCAGGFIWKWRFFDDAGGLNDKSYSPQGKKALDVIKGAYSN